MRFHAWAVSWPTRVPLVRRPYLHSGGLTCSYYRTRRKARCPIGTDRHISPGRWVSTRACASCSCASEARDHVSPRTEKVVLRSRRGRIRRREIGSERDTR
eukprot:6308768-Prymnesium_polylepis.1